MKTSRILALLFPILLVCALFPVVPATSSTKNSVCTVGLADDIANANQRKAFFAVGRYWVFYENDSASNWYYTSTGDKVTWIAPASVAIGIAPLQNGQSFSVSTNGTHVYCVLALDNAGVKYRMGLLNADGSITWQTSAQTIYDSTAPTYWKLRNDTAITFTLPTFNTSTVSIVRNQSQATGNELIENHHPSSTALPSAAGNSFRSISGDYTLVNITVSMYKVAGSPTANLTMYLYASSSDKPSGSVLATSQNNINCSTLTGAYADYNFTFDGTCIIQNNTWYCFEVQAGLDGLINVSNYVRYHVIISDVLEGSYSYYANDAWNTVVADSYYIVYGHPPNTQNLYVMNTTAQDSDDYTTEIDTGNTSGYYYVNPFQVNSTSNAALPPNILKQGWVTDVALSLPDNMFGLRAYVKCKGTAHSGTLYWRLWYSTYQNMTGAVSLTSWDHQSISFSGAGDTKLCSYASVAGYSNQTITNAYVYVEVVWYDNGNGDATSGVYIDDSGPTAGSNGFLEVGQRNLVTPYISVDSSGYPYVAFEVEIIAASLASYQWESKTLVIKSSTNNGTWTLASGYPFDCGLFVPTGAEYPSIIPLTDGKMYLLTGGGTLYGDYYNGTNWGSLSSALTGTMACGFSYSAVAQGDNISLVYTTGATRIINYTVIDPGDSLVSSAVTIQTGIGTTTYPTLTLVSDYKDLYCFWLNASSIYCLQYYYLNSSWSTATTWLTDTFTDNSYLTSPYQVSSSNAPCLLYMEGSSSPYTVEMAFGNPYPSEGTTPYVPPYIPPPMPEEPAPTNNPTKNPETHVPTTPLFPALETSNRKLVTVGIVIIVAVLSFGALSKKTKAKKTTFNKARKAWKKSHRSVWKEARKAWKKSHRSVWKD
jgi:hypothetical protein